MAFESRILACLLTVVAFGGCRDERVFVIERVPARAAREVSVENGVMRWRDDGSEVTLAGVNYYAPFFWDYAGAAKRGVDHERMIDTDILHFRRLGLDYVRVHVFDSQVSDRNGGLLENEHLRLLDYLIDRCASNGLYMVLTPIAWWGAKSADGTAGFSRRWKMTEMTSDPEALKCQRRYLSEFGVHVNRYTGRRYADEPSVVAFELINEPQYAKGAKDSAVTKYVNALAAALRSTGTRKPIFYNSWQKKDAAVAASSVDGMTGSSYPTELDHGMALRGPQLGRIGWSTLTSATNIIDKAKMIYEFDAADTVAACLYPAMALAFRSEGVQAAAQFQYDALPLASENASWRTHFLNLVFTPRRAMSLAIAREVLHRMPRNCPFAKSSQHMKFGEFELDAEGDYAVLSDETDYLNAGDVGVAPTTPERLRRVWGCGSSPIVASSGNGCYFLDRVREGVWRLQLFPSVRGISDPFTGRPGEKVVLLPDAIRLRIDGLGLGPRFCAWRPKTRELVTVASGGTLALLDGDYLLTAKGTLDAADLQLSADLSIPDYAVPTIRRNVTAGSEEIDPRVARDVLRGQGVEKVSDWKLYLSVLDEDDRAPRRFGAKSFADRESVRTAMELNGRALTDRFPDLKGRRDLGLVIRLRALEPETKQVEVALNTAEGASYIAICPLSEGWKEVCLRLVDFRLADWSAVKSPKRKLSLDEIRGIHFTIGKWLFAGAGGPHHVEISEIHTKE